MLKKYKNELLLHLRKQNYPIDKFRFEDSKNTVTLTLKESPLFFRVETSGHNFHLFDIFFTRFVPGFTGNGGNNARFEGVLEELDRWYRNNVNEFWREEGEPDLWRAFLNENVNLMKNIEDETGEFSELEKEKTSLAINHLKKSIEEKLEISEEELKKINKKLDTLNEKVDLLNKTDWKDFANGLVMNIVTSIILDPTHQRTFLELLKQSFSFLPKLIGG